MSFFACYFRGAFTPEKIALSEKTVDRYEIPLTVLSELHRKLDAWLCRSLPGVDLFVALQSITSVSEET